MDKKKRKRNKAEVSLKVNVISAENILKNITSVPPFSFYSIQILYLNIFLFEK
jgi:hypothetical protein